MFGSNLIRNFESWIQKRLELEYQQLSYNNPENFTHM
jgi:hypothetical protein